MADILITQEVELSFTESLVPPVVNANQYDNDSRKIACTIYLDTVPFEVPDDAIANVTGTRPDGGIFQYSTETDPDVVSIEDGMVNIVVTDYMTAAAGRVPVGVNLLDGSGVSLGAFAFVLKVEKAALEDATLTSATYSGLAAAISSGIVSCYIDEDGYLCIESEDGLGLTFSMDDEGNLTVVYGG